MLNGVISRKLSVLDEVLNELEGLRPLEIARFQAEWTVQRAVERDLQILSETVVDVCQRLLSLLGESPATSGVEAVRRCKAIGALSDRAAYLKIVQIRNVIMHRYDQEDPSILTTVVNEQLDEYRAFRQDILSFIASREEPDE